MNETRYFKSAESTEADRQLRMAGIDSEHKWRMAAVDQAYGDSILRWQHEGEKLKADKELAEKNFQAKKLESETDLKRGKMSMWAQIAAAAIPAATSLHNGKKNRKAEAKSIKAAQRFEQDKMMMARSSQRAAYRDKLAYEKQSAKLQDKRNSKYAKQKQAAGKKYNKNTKYVKKVGK